MRHIDDLLFSEPFDLHWQMYHLERMVLLEILKKIRPQIALEIGTHLGGSLQVISRYSHHVISIDINQGTKEKLRDRFPNTDFLCGDSRVLLPSLVTDWNSSQKTPEFILIDGGHSESCVRDDINNILKIIPQRTLIIVMHDSFNPDCRRGMRTANWSDCPYVHEVDLDYVPGLYSPDAHDTAASGSMWSGLGIAVMHPEPRKGTLPVEGRMQTVVDATVPFSCHQLQSHSAPKMSIFRSVLHRTTRVTRRMLRRLYR
jgi:hypothetical protein